MPSLFQKSMPNLLCELKEKKNKETYINSRESIESKERINKRGRDSQWLQLATPVSKKKGLLISSLKKKIYRKNITDSSSSSKKIKPWCL